MARRGSRVLRNSPWVRARASAESDHIKIGRGEQGILPAIIDHAPVSVEYYLVFITYVPVRI